jgi:hypothetical protein
VAMHAGHMGLSARLMVERPRSQSTAQGPPGAGEGPGAASRGARPDLEPCDNVRHPAAVWVRASIGHAGGHHHGCCLL